MQDEFPDVIKRITGEKGCLPRRVFNVDRNVLFWKNEAPQRISVTTEDKRAPGFKAGRESNATVLYKYSPVYDQFCNCPDLQSCLCVTLEGKDKHGQLPVFWLNNKRCWTTRTLFSGLFLSMVLSIRFPWTVPLVTQNIMYSTLKMSK